MHAKHALETELLQRFVVLKVAVFVVPGNRTALGSRQRHTNLVDVTPDRGDFQQGVRP
jgi:hypothetical protein